jgi:erythromycin esterase-like protein
MTDPTDAVGEWLREHAARLDTLDPDAADDRDLEPLRELAGDARVVMIGESMHRIHEFYEFRHRLFRFLARELGFTGFVMESGFAEGLRVDDWIATGAGRPREVLETGVTYHMGKCHEMLDQLAWMREFHLSSGHPLHFYGMDLSGSAATAKPAVEACLPLLDAVDAPYAEVVRGSLLPLFDHLPADRSGLAWAAPAIHSYVELPDAVRFELTARIGELAERLQAMRVDYLAASGDRRAVDAAVRCGAIARHTDAFLAAMVTGPTRTYRPGNIRDAAMAETVEWILEREERIVVVAATGHAQRVPFNAPPFVPHGLTTVGQHLADRLGGQLVVIGSGYGGGDAWLHRPAPDGLPGHSVPFVEDLGASHPSSLDAVLGRAGVGDYLIDLRRVPAGGADAAGTAGAAVDAALAAVEGTQNGPYLQLGDPRVAFDAVYFVDRLSPWHTWIDAEGLTPVTS